MYSRFENQKEYFYKRYELNIYLRNISILVRIHYSPSSGLVKDTKNFLRRFNVVMFFL